MDNLMSKYTDNSDVIKLDMQGNLINFILAKQAEDEGKEIKSTIDHVKLLVAGETSKISKTDIDAVTDEVRGDSYEELINVKDGGNIIRIMIKESGDFITHAFVSVFSDDDTQIIGVLTGKIVPEEIMTLIQGVGESGIMKK